ncbi:MAG: hypothetical protein CMO80_22715 [Verrucomicrobiales bacterium]|nr:hypothetical protein [Verrucomicrobiales bacterium]
MKLVVWSFVLAASFAQAAPSPIKLTLSIPPAKTRVIGDQIPLFWTFENTTEEALAFMWEGCCRVNGRVAMKRISGPASLPGTVRASHVGFGPGIYNSSCQHCRLARRDTELEVQAAKQGPATAHMFAKAIRLNAGRDQKLPSALDNWVLLEETGDYTLTGHYLGVHPKQKPQMPKRTKLWSDRAQSDSIKLSLLSVDDYLKEATARQNARGIQLRLQAPSQLKPFAPATLTLTLNNTAETNQTINWPGDAELWMVDPKGRRLPASRYAIGRFGPPIQLPPNQPKEVTFKIGHELLSGSAFGSYRVFMELKEKPTQLRTPSNDLQLNWNIDETTALQLITGAAERPAVGHRNPQLKLLRVYLLELAETLAQLQLPTATEKSRALLHDLQQAALLKPHQRTPGRAIINLSVSNSGAQLQDPPLLRAFASSPAPLRNQLSRIAQLRRHLGWTLVLNLRISPDTQAKTINTLIAEVKSLGSDWSAAPFTKLFNRYATAHAEIQFVQQLTGNNIARIRKVAGKAQVFHVSTGTPIDWAQALQSHLSLQVAPDISWSELRTLIEPIIGKQKLVELQIR